MPDLYVYCLVGGERRPDRDIVRSGELAAVVGPAPPTLDNQGNLLKQLRDHAETVGKVWAECNDVVPLRFGRVFRGPRARADVSRWLSLERPRLLRMMDRLAGREEYAVEVFYRPEELLDQLCRADRVLALARRRALTTGEASPTRLRFQSLLQERLRDCAAQTSRAWRAALSVLVDDVVEQAVATPRNERRLFKLACLVRPEHASTLFESMDLLEVGDPVHARAVGPWPPYSFVS